MSADDLMTIENRTITPADPIAARIDVYDAETGSKLDLVTELNVTEGWVVQFKRNGSGLFDRITRKGMRFKVLYKPSYLRAITLEK